MCVLLHFQVEGASLLTLAVLFPSEAMSRPSTSPSTPRCSVWKNPEATPCTPPTRSRALTISTLGNRQAAQRDCSISRALRRSAHDDQALLRVLRADPSAAILPLHDGQPVLTAAMARKCSVATLRILLEHGAQHEQINRQGLNAMDALLSMNVPDTFENIAALATRPCPIITRLHVQYAIVLLRYGARASADAVVGEGNLACAACAWSYGDALAAAVLHQWQRQADKDYLGIVADLVSMRRGLNSAALC